MTEKSVGSFSRPDQSQRRVLGKREKEMDLFQRKVSGLLGTMPIDVAQTEAGVKLMEALQEVQDNLTNSKRLIRGEIAPLDH